MAASARRLGVKALKEGPGSLDWELVCEREQVPVPGDENGAFGFGEGEEIVVVGVGRAPGRALRIGGDDRIVTHHGQECGGFVRTDTATELGI